MASQKNQNDRWSGFVNVALAVYLLSLFYFTLVKQFQTRYLGD